MHWQRRPGLQRGPALGDLYAERGRSPLRVAPKIMHRFHFCLYLGVWPVWKSKFYGTFVLNHRVVLHAINATPARWRGDAGSSPLDRARTAASSPRNDFVKNCRAPDTLFDFHTGSCAGTVLSPSFGGGLAWGGGGGGFLPWGGGGLGFLVSPLGGGIGGFSLFGGGTGGFLPGGTGGFFWGGGGRGLASFFGGGGGRGGSLASPLGGGLDAAPVPGDGGASLAAASSFSPDHQLDQEPAAA